jgi:polysaccharide pyruvyl transferase CsaB
MKKVVISGWYGNKNTGDEAILAAMVSALKDRIKNVEITVFSSDPGYTSRTHHTKAVYQLPFGFLPFGLAILRGRIFGTMAALVKTDLFVLGGGGFLSDWQSWKVILQWLGQALAAKMLRKRVMLYALGAGPITTSKGRLLTRLILNKTTDVITVRDQVSKEWLIKAGVTKQIIVTADPAVNLEPVESARVSKILTEQSIELERPLIGICLAPLFYSERFWPGQYDRFLKYRDACIEVTDYLVSKLDALVVFVPMQPSLDVPFAEGIIGSLKRRERARIALGEYTPQEIMGIIGRMDMVIGARFHSLIFAAVMNVPMVGIMYLHKSECFLEQIGQKKYGVGIGDGTLRKAEDIDINKMIAIVQLVWASRKTARNEIKPRITELQKKETLNVDLASALLEEH